MDIIQGPFDKHLEEVNQQTFDKNLEQLNQLTSEYDTPELLPKPLDSHPFQHPMILGQAYSLQVTEWKGSSTRPTQDQLPNPYEEQRLDIPALKLDQAEINPESRLKDQDVSNLPVPPSGNRYMNNFRMDYRPLKLFRKVFYKEWNYREHHKNYQLLQELPGGGTSNVDFIHILTDIGTETFLKEGDWNSRYGHIGYQIRLSLYNKDKKGLRWAQKKHTCSQKEEICLFISRRG
jgi:hypothetical protein